MGLKEIGAVVRQLFGGQTNEVWNIPTRQEFVDNNAVGGKLEEGAAKEMALNFSQQIDREANATSLEQSFKLWQSEVSRHRKDRNRRHQQIRQVKLGPSVISLLEEESLQLNELLVNGLFDEASGLLDRVRARDMSEKQRKLSSRR